MLEWRILLARKKVASVSAWLEKEKCLEEAIGVKDVISRTAEACAVHESTVICCGRHLQSSGRRCRFPFEKSHLNGPKLEDPESM